ncbi:hypothetical protein NC652_041692 [Populus alba x Populus x berolinensis]|nr:hypothetical protein NC652_041692 [Populus alba x Populus x berolinensis]
MMGSLPFYCENGALRVLISTILILTCMDIVWEVDWLKLRLGDNCAIALNGMLHCSSPLEACLLELSSFKTAPKRVDVELYIDEPACP